MTVDYPRQLDLFLLGNQLQSAAFRQTELNNNYGNTVSKNILMHNLGLSIVKFQTEVTLIHELLCN